MITEQKQLPSIASSQDVSFPWFTSTIKINKKNFKETISEINKNKGKFIILFYEENKNKPFPYALESKLLDVVEDISEPDLMQLTILGVNRVKILKTTEKNKVLFSTFEVLKDKNTSGVKVKKSLDFFLDLLGDLDSKSEEILRPYINTKPSVLSDAFANLFGLEMKDKLLLLKTLEVNLRLDIISKIIINLETTEDFKNDIKTEIQNELKRKVAKQQKEYFLREEIKLSKQKLDEISGELNDIEQLRERVNNNPYPKYIQEKLNKEIKKLESIPSQSAESGVIRQYIETVLELPFWQKSNEKSNIIKAKKQLNQDHWGLKKPKDRIIEYLAVRQMNPESNGAIISFVGPPGTGKTSLAKSIATALDRKFIKISLGGVKDESEIRGHRKTYIGAMPGKIIAAMKKAGVVNPVILLDEIDKMSSDYKGDPTSAMLEVLDPEQNRSFQDHYIEEEYDLSNVLFITTANYYSRIPEALIDRLDIIELSSYTEIEKLQIAKNYLIPEIFSETKIQKSNFNLTDSAIKFIISHYTLEAGVRQLKRSLTEIARKQIVLHLAKKKTHSSITVEVIKKLLGNIKYDYTKKEKTPLIGVTMGLAWTSYGGDILPIEIVKYPGKGELSLTGQLKDVMRESASIAFSYIKSNAKKFGIKITDENNIFSSFDYHVHSPDGATPKDGPSAGVTFTTSMISLILNKPVSQHIAMTGEITLNGKVLPIGGLREKAISAHRSGIKKIFIPKENENDITEIPSEVKKVMKFVLVKTYDEIFNELFK